MEKRNYYQILVYLPISLVSLPIPDNAKNAEWIYLLPRVKTDLVHLAFSSIVLILDEEETITEFKVDFSKDIFSLSLC